MEEDTHGFKHINKIYLVGSIMVVVVIFGLSFFSLLIPKGDSRQVIEHDDGLLHEEDDEHIFVTIGNEYQLEYSVGETTAGKLLAKIGQRIGELASKEKLVDEQLDASIIESSFKKVGVDSGVAYSFDIETVNGWIFKIWIRTDEMYGNGFYCSLITRVQPDDDSANLDLAITSEDDVEINRDELIEIIVNWSKSLLLDKSIILNVTSL